MRKLILFAALACSAWGQLQTITGAPPAVVGGGLWTGKVVIRLNSPNSAMPLSYGAIALSNWSQMICVGTTDSRCTSTTAAGTVTFSAYANSTLTPGGTSYSARWESARGDIHTETYIIAVGNTLLSQIRSTTVPVPTVTLQESQVALGTGAIIYGLNGVGAELPLGTLNYCLTAGATAPAWAACSAAAGTVTTVSVTTANGVSGSVATATTTPAITLTLGAITPTSVAADGAVSGAITDKGGQVHNVKGYGAVGDGVADDTVAIQTALSAGTNILFPPGTYKTNPLVTLVITNKNIYAVGATLTGASFGAYGSLYWEGGTIDQGVGTEGGPLIYMTGSNVYMNGVTLTYAYAYTGIQIDQNASNIRLSNLTINDGPQSALTITSGSKIFIDNINITSSGAEDGITIMSSTGPTTDVVITNCTGHYGYDLLKIINFGAYPIRNISLSNCTANDMVSPIYIESNTGTTENITIDNLAVYDADGSHLRSAILVSLTGGAIVNNVHVSNLVTRGRYTNASEHQVVRVVNSQSTFSGFYIADSVFDDIYDGVANDVSNPGYPASVWMFYQTVTSGTASNWRIDNVTVNGISGPAIETQAAITNFRVSNSRFSNIQAAAASGNLVAINAAVDLEGTKFTDLSSTKILSYTSGPVSAQVNLAGKDSASAVGGSSVGIALQNTYGNGGRVSLPFYGLGGISDNKWRYAAIDGLVTGEHATNGSIGAITFGTKLAVAGTTLIERMRIDNAGNVSMGGATGFFWDAVNLRQGFGTNNPNYPVEINAAIGQIYIKSTTGTNYAITRIGNTGGDMWLGRESSTGGALSSNSTAYAGVLNVVGAYPLQFSTNSAVRMTINSSGRALIGTLTDDGVNQLQVNGVVAATAFLGNLTGNVTGNVSGTAPAGSLTGTTLAANVVTSSLTSVGTIATGVWSGTAILYTKGGTGQTTAPDDNLLVGNGTGWDLKALPDCSNATTSKVLYNITTNAFSCGTDQTGGGSGITSLEGQTGATQTFTDDTNVTIVSALDAHAITWAGLLSVARGGTGLASGTSGGILGYTASGTLASSAELPAGAILVGGGAGALPTVLANSSVPNAGELWVGDQAANASSTRSLLHIGDVAWASGSASGTQVSINATAGFAGDLISGKTNSAAAFNVTAGGVATFLGSITSAGGSLGFFSDITTAGNGLHTIASSSSGSSSAVRLSGSGGTAATNFLVLRGTAGGTPTDQFRINGDSKCVMIGQTAETTSETCSLLVKNDLATTGTTMLKVALGAADSATTVIITNEGTIKSAGYQSSDGSAGVTVTTCTGFKNGLCISGT